MNDTDLLDATQTADHFGVAARTIRNWAVAGRLPAVRTPGGQWRFRRADVEALTNPERDSGGAA